MSKYAVAATPDMEFVTLCKQGDFAAVAQRLEAGENPNLKAYVNWRGRLIGFKCCREWGFMMSHQSQDRMMGSALHYAVFGKKPEVVGLLLAFGGSGTERLGYPPHMPAEASVEELAKEVEAKAEELAREDPDNAPAEPLKLTPLFLFFRLWNNLPLDSPKKKVLLEKLPPACHVTLKPYLEALLQRHLDDPSLKILKQGQTAAATPAKATPEQELAAMLKEGNMDIELDINKIAREVEAKGKEPPQP